MLSTVIVLVTNTDSKIMPENIEKEPEQLIKNGDKKGTYGLVVIKKGTPETIKN